MSKNESDEERRAKRTKKSVEKMGKLLLGVGIVLLIFGIIMFFI
ncbi:hypothetical protein [uncultured Clostridium sp.]|nr:hypothetical protein [uncultured Clostridium sp.]